MIDSAKLNDELRKILFGDPDAPAPQGRMTATSTPTGWATVGIGRPCNCEMCRQHASGRGVDDPAPATGTTGTRPSAPQFMTFGEAMAAPTATPKFDEDKLADKLAGVVQKLIGEYREHLISAAGLIFRQEKAKQSTTEPQSHPATPVQSKAGDGVRTQVSGIEYEADSESLPPLEESTGSVRGETAGWPTPRTPTPKTPSSSQRQFSMTVPPNRAFGGKETRVETVHLSATVQEAAKRIFFENVGCINIDDAEEIDAAIGHSLNAALRLELSLGSLTFSETSREPHVVVGTYDLCE